MARDRPQTEHRSPSQPYPLAQSASWRRSGRGEYCRLVSRRKGPRPVTIRLSRGRIEPEPAKCLLGPLPRGESRRRGRDAPEPCGIVSVTRTRSADPK